MMNSFYEHKDSSAFRIWQPFFYKIINNLLVPLRPINLKVDRFEMLATTSKKC